jgi:hypothetical protein
MNDICVFIKTAIALTFVNIAFLGQNLSRAKILYKMDGSDAGDHLGYSVAGISDLNGDNCPEIALGAPFADPDGLSEAGILYIYSGSDGALLYQYSGHNAGWRVGWVPPIAGDFLFNDNYKDLVVGVPFADTGGYTDAGCVDMIQGPGPNFNFFCRFIRIGKGSDEAASDGFGWTVSNIGDANFDGVEDFVVGSPRANSNNGEVRLYYNFSDCINYDFRTLLIGSNANRLSFSVSNISDLDDDGVTDILIGAPRTDYFPNDDAGAIMVKSVGGDTLLYTLRPRGDGYYFGYSVARVGDIDDDGTEDFIVGAPGAAPGRLYDAGSVFILGGGSGDTVMEINGDVENMRLGWQVDNAGDTDGDGKNDVIIASTVLSGTVIIISSADGHVLHRVSGDKQGSLFGYSIAGLDDVNEDGKADFAVGAPEYDSAGSTLGRVFVFSGADASELYHLNGMQSDSKFGYALDGGKDIDGDGVADLIVGAPYYDNEDLVDAGAAYVFKGQSGSQIYAIYGDSARDHFGTSVAIIGKTDGDACSEFIIGAPEGDELGFPWPAVDCGHARVYDGATGIVKSVGGTKFEYDPGEAGFISTSSYCFGINVAGFGDINSDGFADFGIANLCEFVSDDGSVHAFSGATGELIVGYEAPNFGGWPDGSEFGSSIAGGGDYDGDGCGDILVGEPLKGNSSKIDYGRACVFSGKTHDTLFYLNGSHARDKMGSSVSFLGDVTGDGKSEVMISAPGTYTRGIIGAGRATIYSGKNGSSLWTFYGQKENDRLGFAVNGAGDVDGDGVPDVVVGAPGYDSGAAQDVGMMYIYSGQTGDTILLLCGTKQYDSLGYTVAGVGDVNQDGKSEVAVGIPGADTDQKIDAGQVIILTYDTTVEVEVADRPEPEGFWLAQNSPNPFNAATTIAYSLPKRSYVAIKIYNIAGQLVQSLIDAEQSAGTYKITWDGKDKSGQRSSSGIYFYRLKAGEFAETRKMLLLK